MLKDSLPNEIKLQFAYRKTPENDSSVSFICWSFRRVERDAQRSSYLQLLNHIFKISLKR